MVHDNLVGISGSGVIRGNRVFHNTQTGISGQGRVEGNRVYGNATGIVQGDLGSTLTDANHLKPYSFLIQGGVPVNLSFISGNVFNDSNGNGKADHVRRST